MQPLTTPMATSPAPPAPPQPPRRFRRRFASTATVLALVLREMETSYGRSPGGYVWAILEPVAGIAVLTLIFSIAFRAPPLGSNFPIFYASGMLPFLMFTEVSNKVALSLRFSKQLLAYPCVTFLDALVARFLTNILTEIMVAYIVLAGIMILFDTRTVLDPPAIILGFAMAAALAFGVGTLNAFLMTRFDLWQRFWSIATRPLFIISCIFFVFDAIPQPYRDILWWNPLVHVVGQTRSGFYPGYDAPYVSAIYVFGLSIALTATGLVFLRRYHRDLLYG